jgi:3-dehydroquinate dehydratase-2
MTPCLLVLHGPDLARLGRGSLKAEPPLDSLDAALEFAAAAAGAEIRCARGQEAELVRALDEASGWAPHVLVSPGALAPTAWQLRAALAFYALPYAEVFVAALAGSDEHRQRSILEGAAVARRRGAATTVYAETASQLVGVRFAAVPPHLVAKAAAEDAVTAARPKPASARPPAAETLPPPVAGMTVPPVAKAELGRGARKTAPETLPPPSTKTLGRKESAPARGTKTIGRRETEPEVEHTRGVTRAQVRQHAADRLSGRITAAQLASWGREQWLSVQRGGPTEVGHREALEEALQRLALSASAGTALSEPELLDLMARMG